MQNTPRGPERQAPDWHRLIQVDAGYAVLNDDDRALRESVVLFLDQRTDYVYEWRYDTAGYLSCKLKHQRVDRGLAAPAELRALLDEFVQHALHEPSPDTLTDASGHRIDRHAAKARDRVSGAVGLLEAEAPPAVSPVTRRDPQLYWHAAMADWNEVTHKAHGYHMFAQRMARINAFVMPKSEREKYQRAGRAWHDGKINLANLLLYEMEQALERKTSDKSDPFLKSAS